MFRLNPHQDHRPGYLEEIPRMTLFDPEYFAAYPLIELYRTWIC